MKIASLFYRRDGCGTYRRRLGGLVDVRIFPLRHWQAGRVARPRIFGAVTKGNGNPAVRIAAIMAALVSSLRDPEVMIVQQGVQGANGRAADFLRILVDSGAAM